MKLKKENTRQTYAKIEVSLRAIDSIFWQTKQPKNKKHPSDYADSLQEQGYTEYARCPEDEFMPDLSRLGYKNITRVAKLISTLNDSQIRLFTWLLAGQDALHQRGFTFAQPVFINLSSPRVDYLDCYFSAYMLAYKDTIDGHQYFYVTGSLDNINGSMMLLPKDSILKEDQFIRKQAKLISANRVKSPKPVRFTPPEKDSLSLALDVPTIDTVKNLENTPKSAELIKKKKFVIT